MAGDHARNHRPDHDESLLRETKHRLESFRRMVAIDGEVLIAQDIAPDFEKATRQLDSEAMNLVTSADMLLKLDADDRERRIGGYVERLQRFAEHAEGYRRGTERGTSGYRGASTGHIAGYMQAVHAMASAIELMTTQRGHR